MPFEPESIDELLRLVGVSPGNRDARAWLESALLAARGSILPGLAARGATIAPRPSPAVHNAPLEKIKHTTDRLIKALEQLRRYPYSYASFWRFTGFGPVYNDEFERAGVMRTLTNVRDAASKGRINRAGRPRNLRKQHIVDLALAFCARFSPNRPSSDVNNFFPPFAERFFELSTGLSPEARGNGIERQIRQAIARLPLEMERAAHG